MQEAHTNFCCSPSCHEPGEDEITRHLPWNCLYLPLFLCQARSPSLGPPSILPLESLSSSLSSVVLVLPLSISSSLCGVNLPLANLMSGLSGCLLDGSRLRAFQALWQCFPQAPLVSPHTANIHAAHRRMRVGGRNEEQDYWRGEDGVWGVGVHLLRLGWTNLLAKWLAKWEKRVERGLRETKRGEMGKWLKKAHGHFCKGGQGWTGMFGKKCLGLGWMWGGGAENMGLSNMPVWQTWFA